MVPVITTALAAGKSKAVQDAGDAIGQGIAGILGDTRKDKARKERIARLRAQALAGDDGAVVALCYEAFEQARGLPNDPRAPSGTRSPKAVREDAIGSLRQYVEKFGGLPAAASQWASRLNNAPIITRTQSFSDVAADALREGARQGVADSARTEIAATRTMTWAAVKPYVTLAAIAVGVFMVVRYTRK